MNEAPAATSVAEAVPLYNDVALVTSLGLRELADPRLQTFVAGTDQLQPGADVLAATIHQLWQTDLDADGLRAQLETGLPDPP